MQVQPVALQVVSKSIRGTTVFVKVQPTILPNNLPTNIASLLLLLIPETTAGSPVITNWVSGNFIYAAITYTGAVPTNSVYLILNSAVVGSIYENMGYSTTNPFLQTSVSPNLPPAEASLVIPATAQVSNAVSSKNLIIKSLSQYNFRLNSVVSKALSDGKVRLA